MTPNQRFLHATVWYEFIAGISKLYRPGKVSFTSALSKVIKALDMFKNTPTYDRFREFDNDLSKYNTITVLSTDIENLKITAQGDELLAGKSYQILSKYLDNLHQVILGYPDNKLAEYTKLYGQYRESLK